MTHNIKTRVANKSSEVLLDMKADARLSPYVRTDKIPSVYMGAEDTQCIRLVILGQDPTVKAEKSRAMITTVLNLDKPHGSLYRYISTICDELGLELCRHVYATNYAKGFFVRPPTQIKECDVLKECGRYWLPLLQEELSQFPDRPVITLGEPLLRALVHDPKKALVRRYWGYTPDWAGAKGVFSCVSPEDNKLGRILFPLPHQPSLRKRFYDANLRPYLRYVKDNITRT